MPGAIPCRDSVARKIARAISRRARWGRPASPGRGIEPRHKKEEARDQRASFRRRRSLLLRASLFSALLRRRRY
jgi:hypothetical protein